MVFQSYALWPHLRVEQNVAYPLKMRKWDRGRIRGAVADVLKLVGCEALASRYPAQLSGGQQQRIALARALVAEPALVLFDEPLSNLDVKLRNALRVEIRELQARVGFTGLYVTHDQEEAWALADHVVVMQNGRIVQQGRPREVYDNPANEYVGRFIGDLNMIPGRLIEHDGELSVETRVGPFRGRPTTDALSAGEAVWLAVAEEDLHLTHETDEVADHLNCWSGDLERVVDLGRNHQAIVSIGAEDPWRARLGASGAPQPGERVQLIADPAACLIVAAQSADAGTGQ